MKALTQTLATLATLALSAVALHAQAAVVVYTTEADYLAAVGSTRTYIDFVGSPGAVVSGGSFAPAVTFGSCTDSAAPGTCGTTVLHNSNAITDLGGSAAANGVASLAWRFNEPDVFAFAFHYVSGDVDAVQLVQSGSLATQLIDTSAANGFIGLVSDSAFYGGIGVNAVFPGGTNNDRYFIDDFRINAAGATTVPEPGVLGLAGLALMAAGIGRRAATSDRAGRR
ncbi:MAG: PEP-CTERM sorting domain-containing protein [Rubrivivax sp.]|nr:PEP-CTERM sorting domain-containing protein [Rubrivivax sp.]